MTPPGTSLSQILVITDPRNGLYGHPDIEGFTYEEFSYYWPEYKHIYPIVAVTLYLAVVHRLPAVLSPLYKEAPPSIMIPLQFVWNSFLSLFSITMLFGVAIPLKDRIMHLGNGNFFAGLLPTLCDPESFLMTSADGGGLLYWAAWFSLSKYIELGDTLLLIVKKPGRPVPFLGWYHHTTVLLFTWYAQVWRLSAGMAFVFMNVFVHSCMYSYYALKALDTPIKSILPNYRIPSIVAQSLTLLQISQMFVGIGVNGIIAHNYLTTADGSPGRCGCSNTPIVLISCGVMYGSYLKLFIDFYRKKYKGKTD